MRRERSDHGCVNGSQLFNASSTIAAALGGGAGVDANGGVSAPTYNVGGTQVHSVGAAIDNLDGRVTKNTTDIASIKGDLANDRKRRRTLSPTIRPITRKSRSAARMRL